MAKNPFAGYDLGDNLSRRESVIWDERGGLYRNGGLVLSLGHEEDKASLLMRCSKAGIPFEDRTVGVPLMVVAWVQQRILRQY
jgi:hypothetical protein